MTLSNQDLKFEIIILQGLKSVNQLNPQTTFVQSEQTKEMSTPKRQRG